MKISGWPSGAPFCTASARELKLSPVSDLSPSFVSCRGHRDRFPAARWFLVDTTVDEAGRRIAQREGHFYKGTTPQSERRDDADNNEWDFAQVSFDHVRLDGNSSMVENAAIAVSGLQSMLSIQTWHRESRPPVHCDF